MLSFSPPDVLDEILDFIESVSEGFPTYPIESLKNERVQWRKNIQCIIGTRQISDLLGVNKTFLPPWVFQIDGSIKKFYLYVNLFSVHQLMMLYFCTKFYKIF